MQLFLRQPGALGATVVVDADANECFQSLVDRLASASGASTSGNVVSCPVWAACYTRPCSQHVFHAALTSAHFVALQAFDFRGRTWSSQASLASAGAQCGDFVSLFWRLPGGGGDGGSTGAESRSSFLEMYATKKAAKVFLGQIACPHLILCITGWLLTPAVKLHCLSQTQHCSDKCTLPLYIHVPPTKLVCPALLAGQSPRGQIGQMDTVQPIRRAFAAALRG